MENNVVLNEIVEELIQKYNRKEAVVKIMLEKSMQSSYNIESAKEEIEEF